MPKLNIQIEVYSNKGFSEKIYRHQFITGDNSEKFAKKDLIAAVEFLKGCMIEFNEGERGVRHGRNHDKFATEKEETRERIAETKGEDPDPRKVREVVKKVEERFKGAE